jgi:Xaa-Pro aminopeptidase
MLREKLPVHSVAVFFANPVRNRSNDVDYPYHQDPDFYYLTGYTEPNSVLLIFRDDQQNREGKKYNEIIFVQPKNDWEELWTGERKGIDGVKKLGFEMVYDNSDFQYYNPPFGNFDRILFKPFNNDIRDTDTKGDLSDLVEWFKMKSGISDTLSTTVEKKLSKPKYDSKTLGRIMDDLRGIKTPEELVLLQKAIDISCIAHTETMKAARPGMSERELQGVQEFIHRIYGSEAEGYPPIVGSGNNTCTLHYEENSRPAIDSGDLVLMDVGAEYGGYSADVTRTFPVDGTFTPEQKKIYDLVYEAQQASIDHCKKGVSFGNFEKAGIDVISEGLVELGIIKAPSELITYLPHGLSHHIGLDVHDSGNLITMEENMVITIEPGIYIPEGSPCDKRWWKTGVRIEDDLLVQKNGCKVLSGLVPSKSDEIEKLMQQPGILDNYSLPVLDQK